MRKTALRFQAFEDCASLPPIMGYVQDSPRPYFDARSGDLRYILHVRKTTEFILTVQKGNRSEREHVFAIPQYERSPDYWRFPQVISAELCRSHARIMDFDTSTLKTLVEQFRARVEIVPKRHLKLTAKQELALGYLQMAVGAPGHWNLTAGDPAFAWIHNHDEVFLTDLPAWIDLRPTAYLTISRGHRPGLRMIDAAVVRLEDRSGDVMNKFRAAADLRALGIAEDEINELGDYGDRLAKRYG